MYGSTTSVGKPDAVDAAASTLSLMMLLLLLLIPCSQKPIVMNMCPQNTWSATLGEKAYPCNCCQILHKTQIGSCSKLAGILLSPLVVTQILFLMHTHCRGCISD